METVRKIAGHYMFHDGRLVPDPVISLSEDGTVLSVERCENPDRIAGTEFYSGILVPGFVNAHCHLELSCMEGSIPPGGGYLGFAKGMAGKRGDFTPESRRGAISAADASMWQYGVSAVADVCNGSTTFGTKTGSKIIYHSFLELFGLDGSLSLDSQLLGTAQQASKAGLRFSATPHSIYSIEDGPLRQAVEGFPGHELTGEHPLLSVHFMESPQEQELFDRHGDMWNWYADRGIVPGFIGKYRSPAERLTALVPPERNIMLIHNCCLTEEDYDIIAAHFTGQVTWVLCPRSNKYITGLKPPVELLRRKGARIAVGTDSLASNWSLDMIEELKEFAGIPLPELLKWSSAGGAGALGMQNTLGGFQPGTRPGGAVLTGINWQTTSLTPESRSQRIF